MKILFILESFHPNIGGVETLFKNLTESLAQQGHQITVLTSRSPSDNKVPYEKINENLTIIRKPYFNRYLFTLLAFFPAFGLARKHDLIHTTSYNAGLPAYFAGFFTRTKVIITFHEVWGKMWFDLPFFSKFSLSLHYLFEKMLLQLPFHTFIAVSQFTADQLCANGISEKKVKMIYNGIDYNEFTTPDNSQKNDPYKFLYFGRLGISKGLDILIKGAGEVQQDFHLELIIPQEPASFLETIKDMAKECGIDEKLKISHQLSFEELKKRIKSADAVVIPSYSEGFCFCAAESIALDVPTISSDKGALKEVISGKHIKLKEFNPAGMAEAMNRALLDQFDFTEKKIFTLSDSIENYLNFYKELEVQK